jgi:hypothetical protein
MAVFGRGEGVVCGRVALGFVVVLEHREVNHPHRAPATGEQAMLLAEVAVPDLDAQGADGVVHDFRLVGTKENQVAVLRAGALEHGVEGLVVDVLDDRALQPVAALGQVVDADVGQALGTVDLDELGVGVDLAAADATGLGRPPGTRRATTRPFFMVAAPENTLKSTSAITSVTSANCRFTRRSGLSEP